MTTPAVRWLAIALLANPFGCNATLAETSAAGDIIHPADPRFNVFELSNSAGDGTFSSPHGTVLLSFVTKDSRYCRAARFASDSSVVLACRDERGWKIEAKSSLAPGQSTNARAFGGGDTKAISDAIEALKATTDFLDEREIVAAAQKGWRDPDPVEDQALDAREILNRTRQIYRDSKSYSDTGTAHTVYKSRLGERIGETQFRTAYLAPADFRFESTMRDFGTIEVHFIAWRDRDSVDAWYNLNPDFSTDLASIEEALDAGAGISRDASGLIPGLIFPGMKLGGDIVRLARAVRLEDERTGGFDCFLIQGIRWPHKGPTKVWIDKDSFLIRKIYEEDEMKGSTTKTTWVYNPVLNVPPDANSLRFNKPASQ